MDIWGILGIIQTNDIKTIKQAYAAKSKDIHPEEHPIEFQRLHDAYRAAISYAKMMQKESDSFIHVENSILENENEESKTRETKIIKEKSINIEEETYVESFDNLFSKLDFKEIQNNRYHACEYLKEIFESVQWSNPKIWQEYVDSEIFQNVKYDEEFLNYLYYVLQVMQIKTKYAKVLYKALEYDQMELDDIPTGQIDLYNLLKKHTLDPYRFKKIAILSDVLCIILALSLYNNLPMLLPICIFLHCTIHYFIMYDAKKNYKKYGYRNEKDYYWYITGIGNLYCFCSLALTFMWIIVTRRSVRFPYIFIFAFTFLICQAIYVGIKDMKNASRQ